MTLADKIVVLNEGQIIQTGTPYELYNYPKNLFVAGFIGTPKMNILDCYQRGGFIYLIGNKDKKINIKIKLMDVKKIGFRSDNVILSDPNKNTLLGEIKFCEYLGSEQFVYVDCDINDKLIVIKISPKIKVVLNKKVGLKFTSENIYFFSQNGNRIN
jgi:multiple sugar transport system ATP-binding protein